MSQWHIFFECRWAHSAWFAWGRNVNLALKHACNGKEVLWNLLAEGKKVEDRVVEKFRMVLQGIYMVWKELMGL